VEVAIVDKRIRKVDDSGSSARLIRWDWATNTLAFEERDSLTVPAVTEYVKKGSAWFRGGDETSLNTTPKIIEEQDVNTPPKLFVVDPFTGRKTLLVNLNPKFATLQFGRVETVNWSTPSGYEARIGLYYPPNYVPGKRYPLVIQTHGFDPHVFMIDGPYSSSFAAQPLANRGIMVAQLDEDTTNDFDSLREVLRESEKIDDTVDQLDRMGLVDRTRVGVMGFSRTCWHVKYVLTHSRVEFAAASLEDGTDEGYWQYIMMSDLNHWNIHAEQIYGGTPFGGQLSSWIRESPTFRLGVVMTPVRIIAPGQGQTLSEWEWYSALRVQGKPVEMVVMPEDEHPLVRPWNRRISLQGNVDWFRFWLKGEEDRSQEKMEQYQRWERLCDMQIASNPGHPTFCVGTKH
jgi:hypothetical protein